FSITLKRRKRAKIKIILALFQQSETAFLAVFFYRFFPKSRRFEKTFWVSLILKWSFAIMTYV
ncbi:hypothetical protein P9154_01645, partial [Bacillus safensis]|nr:hypothetical protein [Bacillus safensis]